MNQREREVLAEFANRLRVRFPDARIWAFGSRAEGRAVPDSDLDVRIVVSDLDEGIDREIMDIAWRVGFEHDVVISTVTHSRTDFETGPCAHSPLVRVIREDGVPV